MPQNTNEYYNQLASAKMRFEKLIKDIDCKNNQLFLIFRNVGDYHTIDSLLSSFYDRFKDNISRFQLKDMSKFEDPDRALLEIKRIIGHLSNTEREIVHAFELFDSALLKVYNPKKYTEFKKRINAFKKLTYDTPLEIVEECFECEIWRPKKGEFIEDKSMDIIGYEDFRIIDDFKELRSTKLGSYVEECTAYGAKNKNGEIIMEPLVTASLVELSDRLKNFSFVK